MPVLVSSVRGGIVQRILEPTFVPRLMMTLLCPESVYLQLIAGVSMMLLSPETSTSAGELAGKRSGDTVAEPVGDVKLGLMMTGMRLA